MENFKELVKNVNTSSHEYLIYSYEKFIKEMSKERGFNPQCINYTRFVCDNLNLRFKTKEKKLEAQPLLMKVFLRNHYLIDDYSQNIVYDYFIQHNLFSEFLDSLTKPTAQLIVEKQISKYSNISKLIAQDFNFKKYDTKYKHKEDLNFYERAICSCARSNKASIKHYILLMEKFNKEGYPLNMDKVLVKLRPESINFFKYSKLAPFIHDFFKSKSFEFIVAKQKFSLSIHDFVYFQYTSSVLSSLVSHGFANFYKQGAIWRTKITSTDEHDLFQELIQERPNIKEPITAFVNNKAMKSIKSPNKAYWLNLIIKPKEEVKIKGFKI